MFDARLVTRDAQGIETSTPLRVEDYDAATHRGHTLCGDFHCAARVYYRREARAFGDVVMRVPHFATMPNDRHREGCTQHNPDLSDRLCTNIRQALLEGRNILINLNMDLGLSLGDEFARAVDPRAADTPYGRFLRAQNHFAVSARSAADVLRIRAALLLTGHEDALARCYVGHRHEIRKFENFFIAAEKDKMKTLFNALAAGEGVMMSGPRALVTGFPRLLQFSPTKTQPRPGTINGNSGCITPAGVPGVILLQSLNIRDAAIRTDILSSMATWVLATPSLDRAQAAQGRKFQTVSWAVRDESQYVRDHDVPDPTPRYW